MAEREVVFVDGMRTAFGRMGGTIRDVLASDLAGLTVKALAEKTGIKEKAHVDTLFCGTALGCHAGKSPFSQNENVVRAQGVKPASYVVFHHIVPNNLVGQAHPA